MALHDGTFDETGSLPIRFLQWTGICAISSVPSFVVARDEFDTAGMVAGVTVFILAYTAVTGTQGFRRLKAEPFVKTTLYIGYGTRLAMSVLFPVGLFLDVWTGLASIEIVRLFLADPNGFAGTLAITILQGVFLNIILAVFMGAVYLLQRAVRPWPIREGFCLGCGYNLTGNVSGVCPECGLAVVPGGSVQA
ncbi:MAG: hypothetical protein JXB13_12685 [Phycisphaerae bacterium]|nr:hypothetical protein [Phycisphaerae bacterium]